MALLINKPKRVVINTTVDLTINRPELASMLSSDAYWGNTANWKTVYFYYTDPTGKQNITVTFPTGKTQAKFTASSKVRQAGWILSKIVLKDYDLGLKTLLRSKNLAQLQACDIVVAVANRTPSKIFLSNTSPLENQTFVGNLTATDPDILDPLSYSIVSGFGDAASFQIVGSNALHFVTAPNYEAKNQYSVKIRVTDSSDAYYEEAFTINIVDANDAPSNITLSNNTINENLSINSVVGTLSVTDEDAGSSHTFALSGTDAASFNLNGNQLRSSAVFDYETKASYSITVTATDNAGATYSKSFNISVLNVNEAPTGITLSNNTINEYNSTNAVIGFLTTTDVDGGDTFTYSIIGGDTSAFNINGNQLRASITFDYETKFSYSVQIRSTDAGGLSTTQTFNITVNNIAEAPTDITLSGNSINENSSTNTVIGTLSATVPTAQSVVYSLVGGDVASFNINGNQLRSSASFDFETKSSYSITIRGSTGGESLDKAFTINVGNVSEPPSNILLSATSIDENNSVNAVVGTLTAVGGDVVTFSIIGGDTSAFNINGNELRASVAFNFESKSSYSVTVRATTAFGATYDKSFAITVNNVDEFAPSGVRQWGGTIGGYAIATYSSAAAGAMLFRLGVIDADYANDAFYDTRGATNKHTMYVDELRLYKTDGSYELPLYGDGVNTYVSDGYGNNSKAVVRLARDTTNGYYIYESDYSNNKTWANASYFWMRMRIYNTTPHNVSGSYVTATFTFSY
jgi:mRNA-degrading endonuclease HigB of HigAB toxin-antitoxin module